MKTLLAIFLLSTLKTFGQPSEVQELYRLNDTIKIAEFISKTDKCFTTEWQFDSIHAQAISHQEYGFLFFFHKKADSIRIERWYCFNTDARFRSASETRYRNNVKESIGEIYIDSNGIWMIEQIKIVKDLTDPDRRSNEVQLTCEVYQVCSSQCSYVFLGSNSLMNNHFKRRIDFYDWIRSPMPEVVQKSTTCGN